MIARDLGRIDSSVNEHSRLYPSAEQPLTLTDKNLGVLGDKMGLY